MAFVGGVDCLDDYGIAHEAFSFYTRILVVDMAPKWLTLTPTIQFDSLFQSNLPVEGQEPQ